jgi:hypothetical protein
LLTLTGGGAARVADTGEPADRTPVEAAAGRAPNATAAATKTARAGPAVTVLSLMRAPRSRPIHGWP